MPADIDVSNIRIHHDLLHQSLVLSVLLWSSKWPIKLDLFPDWDLLPFHMWFFVWLGTIWKTWKTPMEELLLVTKNNTPPWMFFKFFKLYKWYQIPQRTTLWNTFIDFLSQLINTFKYQIQTWANKKDRSC